MLQTILKGKFGRNLDASHLGSSKDIYKTSEDALTASVFNRLFYLNPELFIDIIKQSAFNKINIENSIIDFYEFWPKWFVKENDISFVEPDIFISCQDYDIIVEAKIDDNSNPQSKKQWDQEVLAYKKNKADIEDKKVYLLVIGGLDKSNDWLIDGVEIIKITWKDFFNSIQNNLNTENNTTNFILGDISQALHLHGFFNVVWLEALSNNYNIKQESINYFTNRRIKKCKT